ncbi:hypothetical protein D3C75_808600 [compost metagenome]
MPHRIKQGHRGHHGHGQGKDDFPQGLHLAGSVHPGRFLDLARQLLEKSFNNHQIEGADQMGHHQHPGGIQEMQRADQQIRRNQTAAEHHGENNEHQKGAPSGQIFLGQRVSGNDGKQHIEHRAHKCPEQCDFVGLADALGEKHLPVACPGNGFGNNHNPLAQHLRFRCQRYCHHVQKRKQAQRGQHNQYDMNHSFPGFFAKCQIDHPYHLTIFARRTFWQFYWKPAPEQIRLRP